MQEFFKARSRREEIPQGNKLLLLLKNCIFIFFNPGEPEGDSSINQRIQDGKQRLDDRMSKDTSLFHPAMTSLTWEKKSHLDCLVECNCMFPRRLPPLCRRTPSSSSGLL